MFCCPKCATHVKDDQAECPVCQHVRPAPAAPEPDDAAPLLEELFPPQPRDDESLVPTLHDRNLAKGAGKIPWLGFLIGFLVAEVIAVLVCWASESSEDSYYIVMRGLALGSFFGCMVGTMLAFSWQMWEPLYWSIVARFRPVDPGRPAGLAPMLEEDQEEDPFDGEWCLDEQVQTNATHNPAPSLPSPADPKTEPTDAFRPAT
jgi:hypothetical protein